MSQCLPYPPDGGVKIRTYNILRLLSRTFHVTALCFYRWKPRALEHDVTASVAALRSLGSFEAFPIPQEHNRLRLVWDHLRSVLQGRVYTVYAYQSRDYRGALERLLQENEFDLVHADSLDLSGYFPILGDLPIVCTHHDATSVLLRRRGELSASRLQAWYLKHQSSLTRAEEREWCERVALNVTVSPNDAVSLRAIAPEARFATVSNGVDTDYFLPEVGTGEGIVFVGGTTWFPNRDALEYFAESILPALKAQVDVARVTWVGRARPEEIRRYRNDYGLQLTGYVPDVRPFIRDAACYIVPIRSGGGTRIKILDAWAMGKAVVSTSIGCEGLDAIDGENILVRDDPREFANAVVQVLGDATLRRRLGHAARRTVEDKYSWEVIGRSMIEHYRGLLSTRARAESTRRVELPQV